jgi:galactonate dehydratase
MVEDPLQIDSIQVTAEIARGTRVPMANGERLHSIWEFRELLAAGGSQFVRPDLGLAGGLTGVRKIAAIAEAHHASVVTHNCLGPLLTAASIHLDLSIPNVVTQEYSRIDEEINGGAIRSSFARQGGWIHANDQAGLGVEVDLHDIEPVDLVGRPIHEIATRQDGSVAFSV